MDEQTAASILYGGGSAAAGSNEQAPPAGNAGTETPPGEQTPAPSVAERRAALNEKRAQLAAESDALTAEERQAAAPEPLDAAELLFGGTDALVSVYGPALADSIDALAELAPLEVTRDREQIVERASLLFHDAGVKPAEAGLLHSIFVGALTEPPSAEQVETWRRESNAGLAAKYPDSKELERRHGQVRAFVDARPGLKQLLERTGTGSHPKIVATLMENADRLRIKPRAAKPESSAAGGQS